MAPGSALPLPDRALGGNYVHIIPARALLLAIPLVLALAACQNRTILDPDEIEAQQAPGHESADAVPYGVLTDHPCPNIFEPPCADGTGCDPSNDEYFLDVPASLTYTWSYDCNPDGYSFSLDKQGAGGGRIFETLVTTYDSSIHGPARELTPDVALEPATHYLWHISAFQSDIFPSEIDQITSNSFWTGPLCGADEMVAPIPVSPYSGQVITTFSPLTRIFFTWDYQPTDCIPATFYAQVAEDADFTVNVMDIDHAPLLATTGASDQRLGRCQTYYWRVRATLGEGGGGPWSEPVRFYVAPPGGMLSCLRMAPIARARVAATCRIGPGTAYARMAYVPAGEGHPADGRNADGSWIWLQDLRCYINRELVEFEPNEPFPGGPAVGDLLSILPDPPLPVTETEEPDEPDEAKPVCQEGYWNRDDCLASGGTWDEGKTYCHCP